MFDSTRKSTRLWAIAVIMLALAGCQGGDGAAQEADAAKDKEKEQEEVLPTPVEVAVVTRGDIAAVYTGTATLEADGEAVAMAKVGGQIEALLVAEGDRVTAGQPVARLAPGRARSDLKRTKLDSRRRNMEVRNEATFARHLAVGGHRFLESGPGGSP